MVSSMKRLLLIGAGHVHLFIIKQLIKSKFPDTEVILLSPNMYQYYSGMFSGFAEGIYNVDDIRINIQELAGKCTVQFLKDSAVIVDPYEKRVQTKNGRSLSYDVISFDIGSETTGSDSNDIRSYAKFIKPNYLFAETLDELRTSDKLVIVGGGAAGIEISLSLQEWRNKNGYSTPITLISASRLMENERIEVINKAESIVEKSKVKLLKNTPIETINEGCIQVSHNREVEFNDLLWLTGPKASNLFLHSGLPTDNKGFLLVNQALQSSEFPNIFGAGDCISLSDYPHLSKNGVYAIRQAPILYGNIFRYLKGERLSAFLPQSKFLSILSIGQKRGLLLYGKRMYTGELPWRLKNFIDRRYMNSYRT